MTPAWAAAPFHRGEERPFAPESFKIVTFVKGD